MLQQDHISAAEGVLLRQSGPLRHCRIQLPPVISCMLLRATCIATLQMLLLVHFYGVEELLQHQHGAPLLFLIVLLLAMCSMHQPVTSIATWLTWRQAPTYGVEVRVQRLCGPQRL